MPSELRFVTFYMDEIFKIISIYNIKENLPPPSFAQVTAIKSDAEQENVILSLATEKDGDINEMSFTMQNFVMALVFFCQAGGIPIPRRGKKLLVIQPNSIVMKIELDREK